MNSSSSPIPSASLCRFSKPMVDDGFPLSRARALEQVPRSLFSGDGELGASEVTDHQRVAGQHEPRLVRPGAITHKDTDVFGGVPRGMQHLRGDVAERKHLFITRSSEWKRNVRMRREHILGAGCLGELPARREMVSVNVGVDDKMDAHAGGLGGPQVGLDLADRIDHGTGGASTAAEQVGDANGLLVQELADDHGLRSRTWWGNIQSFC